MFKCIFFLFIALLYSQSYMCTNVTLSFSNENFVRSDVENVTKKENCADLQEHIIKLSSTLNKYPVSCVSFGESSGIHTLLLPNVEPFPVSCDSRFAGPGWTVILRRVDDSVDFNRDWSDYLEGFGDLHGNIWLGLEKIHRLTTSQPHELYVHIESFENKTRYARYDAFVVGSETELFEIKKLGKYIGNAGHGMIYDENMKFSTRDRVNDKWTGFNCAKEYSGGWWYNQCSACHLTAPYKVGHENKDFDYYSIFWNDSGSLEYSIKFVQLMIRPIYYY